MGKGDLLLGAKCLATPPCLFNQEANILEGNSHQFSIQEVEFRWFK